MNDMNAYFVDGKKFYLVKAFSSIAGNVPWHNLLLDSGFKYKLQSCVNSANDFNGNRYRWRNHLNVSPPSYFNEYFYIQKDSKRVIEENPLLLNKGNLAKKSVFFW